MIVAGDPAPDVTLRSQHGETVTTGDLAGAAALLVFFPFAFSSICSAELADLRDRRRDLDELGVRVLGVSCDPMFALRVLDDRDELGFTLLSDFWPHGAAARAFGCFDAEIGAATRGSFLLDPDGVVRWSVVLDTGQRRDIEAHVDAARAFS
jgi:peroxiredoxin